MGELALGITHGHAQSIACVFVGQRTTSSVFVSPTPCVFETVSLVAPPFLTVLVFQAQAPCQALGRVLGYSEPRPSLTHLLPGAISPAPSYTLNHRLRTSILKGKNMLSNVLITFCLASHQHLFLNCDLPVESLMKFSLSCLN